MIIRTQNKDIPIKNTLNDSMKQNGKVYPALIFNFENEIKAEDVAEILNGDFELVDDEGNILGGYTGYTTLKNITLSVGKITTVEQERDALALANTELSANLHNVIAENAAYKENIEALEQENAELLFNSLTGEDFNEVLVE